MRGDGLRLGWRTLIGAVLLAVLFLHGFSALFVTDGYTMGILGLLVVLALAGELESARVGSFQVKFRKLALQRIESGLDDLPPASGQGPEPEDDDGGGGGPKAPDPSGPVHEWRSLAEVSPKAAVLAFFTEVERLMDKLYEPIRDTKVTDANLTQKVDLLVRYRVISASEARIVLDLVDLRNAYVHGARVDHDEAIRLIAVGARLLPALSMARRRLGQAFEDQVGEILEAIRPLVFARQHSLRIQDGPIRRIDFLVVEPVRIVIEAKLVTERVNLVKRELEIANRFEGSDLEVAIVVPAMAQTFLKPHAARGAEASFTYVPIDELQEWLEARIGPET